MRSMKDRGGVVFDVYEDQFERFMDVFNHLKENDSRVDFVVQKCAELPDLTEEGGFDNADGSNWRGGGGGDSGYGGGGYSKHSRHQSYGSGY